MKNIIQYLRDKIYYVMGATVIILILLIIISSCSMNSSSYESMEEDMVSAAKEYYNTRKNKLPKNEDGVVKVTTSTLIDAELLDELVDPKDDTTKCSGYVEVTKVDKEYSYIPFLTCKGNYEPKYLYEKVKSTKTDELGNGVYDVDGNLIYRGKDVNNYVKFNDELWRIVRVDENKVTYLVIWKKSSDSHSWDSAFNTIKQQEVGDTTKFLNTDIRKELNRYYDNLPKDVKAKLSSHSLCVGKYYNDPNSDSDYVGEVFSREKECSIIQENEKVGLLNVSDYAYASLDNNCKNLYNKECNNYNYLNDENIVTWTLNSMSNNTYKVFYIDEGVKYSNAINEKRTNYVIYLNDKAIVTTGSGTLKNPYIIK